MRYTHPIVALALVVSSGCVGAHEAAPIVALQQEAVSALARHSVQTHTALVATTDALLEVRRAALATRLEARALTLLYGSAPEPEIGGLSGHDARRWLDRFAAGEDRGALITELPVSAALERDSAGARAALDERAEHAAALFADLVASTALIESYTDAEAAAAAGEPRALLAEIYSQELRRHVEGDERRAAADRIVALLLGTGGAQ